VGEAARDLDGELEQLVELLGAERGKVLVHERLGLGGQGHAERIARLLGLFLAPRVEGQRFPLLVRFDDAGIRLVVERRRRDEPRWILLVPRDPPEGLEAPVEGGDLFGSRDKDGAKAEVELLAIGDVEMVERANRVGDFDECYGETGPPEQRREPRDRRRQLARHRLSSARAGRD